MPLFPNLDQTNPSNVNAVPISTQSLNQYDSLVNPFFVDPNFQGNLDDVVFVDSNNNFYAGRSLKNKEELTAIIYSGILSGMEITTNAQNPNSIDISAGEFVVATASNSLEDVVVTFAGATNIPVTNASQTFLKFVYVNASSVITFLDDLSADPTLCKIGEIGMSFANPTNVSAIYNKGSRLTNNRIAFTDYINSFGVYHRGISIRKNQNNGYSTDGGSVTYYSQTNPKLIQSDVAVDFIPISSTGTKEAPLSVFTATFFKRFFTQDTATVINNANEHVIWTVYVALDGKFYLLKPQSKLTVTGEISNAQILNYLATLVLPNIIQDYCAIVGVIVANGTDTTLDNFNIYQIKNKLSGGVGYVNSTNTASPVIYTLPIPQPLVSSDEPIGTTQLASDGTQYVLKEGAEGLNNNLGNVAVSYNLNTKSLGTIRSKGLPDNKVFWVNTDNWGSNTTTINSSNGSLRSNITGLGNTSFNVSNTFFTSSSTTVMFNAISSLIPDGANLITANGNYHIFCFCLSNSYSFFTGSLNNSLNNFFLASQTVAQNMHTNFKKAGIKLTERVDWDITTNYSNIYNVNNIDYKFPFIAMYSKKNNVFQYSSSEQINTSYTSNNSGHNLYTYYCGFSTSDTSYVSHQMAYYFSVVCFNRKISLQSLSNKSDSRIIGYFLIKKGI